MIPARPLALPKLTAADIQGILGDDTRSQDQAEATAMFRIIRGQDFYATVATIDDVGAAVRKSKPGRYVVEEMARAGALLPSGHSCRRWGMAIRDRDGQVTLDRDPWPE
jgi:hypothetical protein